MSPGNVERLKRDGPRDMTPDEIDEMDRFFVRMQAIYRNLWGGAFKTEAMLREAQKEWLDTFYRAKLTGADISEGILRSKQAFQFPPTPKEFLAVLPRRRAEHQIQAPGLPEPEEHKTRRRQSGIEHIKNLKAMINREPNRGKHHGTRHQ